jgi:SH3-like domain-containing protein
MPHLLRIAASLASVLLLLAGAHAAAQQMVSVSRDEVNLRSGPGTRHPAEWILEQGYPLKVIGSRGDWLKVVDFENDTGWIHRPLTTRTPHHVVTAKVANMRSRPSTGSAIIARLAYGDVLKTLERSGEWVRLQRKGGPRGWVARRLLWGW